MSTATQVQFRPVRVPTDGVELAGDLSVPPSARGIVVFAHGSGSGRGSPRNRQVAQTLNDAQFATLLVDLLTAEEERVDQTTAEFRFDIPRLAARVIATVDWAARHPELNLLPIGLFGASTGAAAALVAAAERPTVVRAVVSRGGRPDLAGRVLRRVKAPTLLLVGSLDDVVVQLNRDAMSQMVCQVSLVIVPGATHLFPEPGALETVAQRAATWFTTHLGS